MRLVLITALVFAAAAADGAPAAAQRQGPVDVSPNTTSTGQPPFGGTFESRLQRLGADVDGGVKHGWISLDQARAYESQINEMRQQAKDARAKNNGRLPAVDNKRLQARVNALHEEIGDLAVAARRGGERTTSEATR